MNTDTTYEVNVTPSLDGLTPRYDASIYRMVHMGVCGPWSERKTFASLAEIDEWLTSSGYTRSTEYGPVCANGFATAYLTLN